MKTPARLSPAVLSVVNFNPRVRRLGLRCLTFLAAAGAQAADVIRDDADPSGITISGVWNVWTSTNNAVPGYYGNSYLSDGNTGGGKSVQFTPDLPAAGLYQVSARWTQGTNRASNAPVTINHAAGSATVPVDQRSNGGKWFSVGTYYFNAGTGGNVVVGNTGANGVVVADAIRFEQGLIKDNADPAGVTITGSWTTGTSPAGFSGSNYLSDGGTGSGKSVRLTPTLPVSGIHQVFIRWPQGSGTNRATNIPIEIVHSSGTRSLQVDQRVNGSAWAPLGTYHFHSGTAGSILISNAGANGSVIADSVKFVSGDASPVANARIRDTFTDADRTDGAESADAAWHSLKVAGSALAIVNDNGPGGIGGDSALKLTPTSWSQGLIGNLPAPVTLEDGDSLILTFKWRYTGTTNTNFPQRLRFGFFNSGGSPTTADNQLTVRNNDFGYWAGTNPASAGPAGTGLMQETASDEILSGNGLSAIGTAGASVSGGTTAHTAMLKIARSGTTLALSASIDDQAPATAVVSNPATYLFHAAAIAVGVGNPASPTVPSPLIVDDIRVDRTGPPPGAWTLWLDEEFNGTDLNYQVWSKGYRTPDIINNELQAYRPENVSVADGLCTIKIEKKPGSRMMDMTGYQSPTLLGYASGAIQTYNKWAQKYGYFETRLRLPNSTGTWPAFWSIPDRGTAQVFNLNRRVAVGDVTGSVTMPLGNEHDVFEIFSVWKNANFYRSHSGYIWKHQSTGHLSWGDYALANQGAGPEEFYFPNGDTEFHTYGMHWAPDRLVFYIDGTEVLRRDNPPNNGVSPEYLLLNVAMRNDCWLRSASLAEIDADLIVPKYMHVDYVKVWVDNTLPVPVEYLLDNTSGSGVTWLPNAASWDRLLTSKPGYWWQNFAQDQNSGKGTKSVRFSPNLFTGGSYEVSAWWPTGGLATNVPIDIIHASGTATITANQQTSGGSWYSLGTYTFTSGTSGAVVIRNGGTTNSVIADAVRFLKSDQEYQAEHFTAQSGAAVESAQAGFTGVGYVTFPGGGSSVEWNNVNQTAGTKTLTFRYANGSAANRTCELRVNGILIGNLPFPPTGSWTTWSDATFSHVVMLDGLNTVTLAAGTTNGGPALDRMEVE